jgi:UDP-N-acetylglucosamine 2-epimerase (non-hydrolysing)
MKKKILCVVGTRPNFIKITQFEKEFGKFSDRFEYKLCFTGQHYDKNMADIFFEQLQINKIDFSLGIHQGTPAEQIGKIICELDKIISVYKPALVLVVGDVNSTLAAAIATNKNNIQLAHIESGLRSFDRTMPEEFNRILTDELSDFLFVTEQSGIDNLNYENKASEKIHLVGNTMIDTLVAFDDSISKNNILEKLKLSPQQYILMTMHRPANVDEKESLEKVLRLIEKLSEKDTVVFPIHPRTRNNLGKFNLQSRIENNKQLILTEPLDYFSFQKLIKECKVVITDSGGIQEETTFRKIPCLTLRKSTERPSTVDIGTNEMIDFSIDKILTQLEKIETGTFKKGMIPPLWDGHASERIVQTLLRLL